MFEITYSPGTNSTSTTSTVPLNYSYDRMVGVGGVEVRVGEVRVGGGLMRVMVSGKAASVIASLTYSILPDSLESK